MENYDDRIWVIITRSLTNEATDSEKDELEEWLNENSEHRVFFSQVQSSWNQKPVDFSFLFDYKSGLNKLRRKVEEAERENNNPGKMKSPVPSFNVSRPASFKIAASILLLVIALSAFITIQYWEHPVVNYATTAVEQRIITLPDGSQIRLNANSMLSFPEHLAGSKRKVKLEGEAFFKVAKNPERPFIVQLNEGVVRVLGTTFNVKASNKAGIMVAVMEGEVSLRRRTAEAGAAKLESGQLGWLPPGKNKVAIEQAEVENYLSWMNGRLAFDEMPLEQVMLQLERIYDVECKLQDPSLTSLRLTAYTERTSLEEVLDMIALSLNITYRMEGDTVLWEEKK